jgi:CelD/BcsL family acetyltransferase involved in cellulose biosynthesis
MRAEFLAPDTPRWTELLAELGHDVYHVPGYAALSARQEDGEAIAFLAEEGRQRFFVPLIVRPIDPDLIGGAACFDATCPYGYPGPLLSPDADTVAGDFVARAAAALVDGMRQRRIITGFTRLHPLLPVPTEPLALAGRLVQHGETISIDLTQSDEEIWHHTRRDHRKDINRARRQGQVARMDETWEHFDAFVAIYHQTMQRLGAQDVYFFSQEYFTSLRTVLGDHVHLSVVEIGGELAGAGLVTEMSGIVQNHLSGTRQEFMASSPEKLRVDFLRGWAKARGNRRFHLGGGLGGRPDALFQFKAGFSACRHAFWTWRLVADPWVYRRAVATWQDLHGVPADDVTGFFPAYRKLVALDGVGERNGLEPGS